MSQRCRCDVEPGGAGRRALEGSVQRGAGAEAAEERGEEARVVEVANALALGRPKRHPKRCEFLIASRGRKRAVAIACLQVEGYRVAHRDAQTSRYEAAAVCGTEAQLVHVGAKEDWPASERHKSAPQPRLHMPRGGGGVHNRIVDSTRATSCDGDERNGVVCRELVSICTSLLLLLLF